MHRLIDLISRLDDYGVLAAPPVGLDDDIEIDHVANDSRRISPGGIFVAIRGGTTDGHVFIDKAVKNGAVAIVCEQMPEDLIRFSGISFVRVHNSRRALAVLAQAHYGDPSREIQVLGVTGTNGKTTTTFLLHHALTQLGAKSGLIGTVEARIGEKTLVVTHTTPDALELNALIRQMVDQQCTHLAMEVSSHALDQGRVQGLHFDVGIFTNLSRDHLDYHASFEAYLGAKRKLFLNLSADAAAVYNADDPSVDALMDSTPARRISYGFDADADIRVEMLANEITGLHLRLDGLERTFRLVGRFNAYNLAAAYAGCLVLGFERTAVIDALASAPPVRGRFEQITFQGGPTAIIDYAHTPDALENVLQTINETRAPGQTLWCVFGCGGNRDVSKRRMMGAIAEQYADRVIVTSDNPRHEDPEAIMNDIRRGMSRPTEARWIVDRREAIRAAATSAGVGDVVLIAGKGHETYQIIGDEKRPFDDRAEVLATFGTPTSAVT